MDGKQDLIAGDQSVYLQDRLSKYQRSNGTMPLLVSESSDQTLPDSLNTSSVFSSTTASPTSAAKNSAQIAPSCVESFINELGGYNFQLGVQDQLPAIPETAPNELVTSSHGNICQQKYQIGTAGQIPTAMFGQDVHTLSSLPSQHNRAPALPAHLQGLPYTANMQFQPPVSLPPSCYLPDFPSASFYPPCQSAITHVPPSISSACPAKKAAKKNEVKKLCSHCGTDTTPTWRRHKKTHQTVCNACGLYYKLHEQDREFTINSNGQKNVKRKPRNSSKKKAAAVNSKKAQEIAASEIAGTNFIEEFTLSQQASSYIPYFTTDDGQASGSRSFYHPLNGGMPPSS